MLTPKNYLRQNTKYDAMLGILLTFAAPLDPENQHLIARIHDNWNTLEGEDLLNSACTTDPTGPAVQASEVISWLCYAGDRPKWLHTIKEQDFIDKGIA